LKVLALRFRSADLKGREKMIENEADHIETFWKQDMEFDRDTVIDVSEL